VAARSRRGDQFIEIAFVARLRYCPDCLRLALSQGGISRKLAARLCSFDPRFGPFSDQRAFELCNGAQHLQRKHALRRRRIDGISDRSKVDATLFEILDNLQKMTDGAGKAVKPHYDEDITGHEF
jgi:hypothetical protein